MCKIVLIKDDQNKTTTTIKNSTESHLKKTQKFLLVEFDGKDEHRFWDFFNPKSQMVHLFMYMLNQV